MAAFGLAYSAGLVIPGAPGGVGVFEATLLLRMNNLVPDARLIAIALCYRILSTIADVALSVLILVKEFLSSSRFNINRK